MSPTSIAFVDLEQEAKKLHVHSVDHCPQDINVII